MGNVSKKDFQKLKTEFLTKTIALQCLLKLKSYALTPHQN